MRHLLLSIVLLIFAQGENPPLVGPVIYQPLYTGAIVFQDLGSGEVWEINTETLFQSGDIINWSPNGCYAIYGNRSVSQYALIDIQGREITKLDLSVKLNDAELTNWTVPYWSPDGTRFVYSLFDGMTTSFAAYDLATGEIQLLYVYEGFGKAQVIGWPSENTLVYHAQEEAFTLDLTTGEITYRPESDFITALIIPDHSMVLRSPNQKLAAVFFDIERLMGAFDVRMGYYNDAEMEAMSQGIIERPGIEIYHVDTGETSSFDLDGHMVSTAKWSPDGEQLAILTWPEADYETATGAYLYNSESDAMTALDSLQPAILGEYGYFQPNWSSDNKLVTLFGFHQGWVVYNLDEELITPLEEAFQTAFAIRAVPFSPITHYEVGACG